MISFFNISYKRNNKKLFSHYWWVWPVTPDYLCDPDYYPVTSWWHSVFTPATQQHNYQSGSMIDWFGILPFYSKTSTELLQYFSFSFRCSTISLNYPFPLSLHENFTHSNPEPLSSPSLMPVTPHLQQGLASPSCLLELFALLLALWKIYQQWVNLMKNWWGQKLSLFKRSHEINSNRILTNINFEKKEARKIQQGPQE